MHRNLAVLVRAHRQTATLTHLLTVLKDSGAPEIHLVWDTEHGDPVPHADNVLTLSQSRIDAWDFDTHPRDWGWICGDYCYYVAADALPDCDRFVLIESDVFVGAGKMRQFLDLVSRLDASAGAARLKRYPDPPKFSADLRTINRPNDFGCIFPVSFADRHVVAGMLKLRREIAAAPETLRVNDEAVLATASLGAGLPVVDFFDHPALFAPEDYETNPPHLLEPTRDNGEFGFRHPVLSLDEVLELSVHRVGLGAFHIRRVRATAAPHISRAVERAYAPGRRKLAPDPMRRARVHRLAILLKHLPEFEQVSIVDVGANPLIEGTVSYAELLRFGQARVIGFEPNPEALEALLMASGPFETYFPEALGAGGSAQLHVTEHPGFTSLYRPDSMSAGYLGFERDMKVAATQEVETRRLDDIAEISLIDMLKIDVQGAERDVIVNGREKLDRVLLVQSEVRFFPLYEGEPSYGDLERALKSLGLRFFDFHSLSRRPSTPANRIRLRRSQFRQVVDGDAFFVRDLSRPEDMTTAELSRLAVIADSVMGAFDLTLACLDRLASLKAVDSKAVQAYLEALPPNTRRNPNR